MADLIGSLWLNALSEAKSLLTSSDGEIQALDWVFKLHSHVTLIFLLLSSGILQVAQVRRRAAQAVFFIVKKRTFLLNSCSVPQSFLAPPSNAMARVET